jgi:hypothetical protein
MKKTTRYAVEHYLNSWVRNCDFKTFKSAKLWGDKYLMGTKRRIIRIVTTETVIKPRGKK